MNTNIEYFDGERIIKIEVSEKVNEAYLEICRYEDRMNKRKARREISLEQLEDDDGFQLVDLLAEDLLCTIIKNEERKELNSKIKKAFTSFTQEQKYLVKMLKQGLSVTKIASKLGVDKSAVSHMRKRIQKKIKKYL